MGIKRLFLVVGMTACTGSIEGAGDPGETPEDGAGGPGALADRMPEPAPDVLGKRVPIRRLSVLQYANSARNVLRGTAANTSPLSELDPLTVPDREYTSMVASRQGWVDDVVTLNQLARDSGGKTQAMIARILAAGPNRRFGP